MTLANGDLTTLAVAKAYVEPTPSDAMLTGLITRVSASIRSYINRPFLLPRTYVEKYNGQNTNSLVLYSFPVIGDALTELLVSGSTIQVAPQLNNNTLVNTSPPLSSPFGYRMPTYDPRPPGNPSTIQLVGGYFPYGQENIVATYRAGYEVVDETATVPAATAFEVAPSNPYGNWASDEGVTLADGTPLVATSGTPAPGQYRPPAPDAASPRLVYTFNAAQAGANILLSYGFVPSDLEQVALEVIAERASYRRRVGVLSQSLAAQESISFGNSFTGSKNNPSGMNDWAEYALQAYVNVLPPPIGADA